MKTKISVIIASAITLAGTLTSCQQDFEEINTDHRYPTESELNIDNLNVGGLITAFEETIFPVGNSGTEYVNDYQIPYTLAGACWTGYIAPTQNKWVGRGFPTYSLKAWSNYTFNVMAGYTYRQWLDIKRRTKDDPAGYAIAQIIKVAAVHKATDTFGPIPYSQTGVEGITVSIYDSQKDVYQQMLADLDSAVINLNNAGHDVFTRYDLIYDGNYTKWMKFGNSLMLRLAMRCVYADEALARKYAEKALTNPRGVITDMDDNATLSEGAGITLKNPLTIINGAYNDTRMGAEIYSYLKGYSDPRIDKYFTKGTINDVSDYYAVRTNLPNILSYQDAKKFSTLKVADETPVYIVRASEVYFLRAEGALRGWQMNGTAEELYKKGIETSFAELGLKTSDVETYMANATAKPAKYVDPVNTQYSAAPVSTITIPWDSKATFETNLERIITQKYLALFPDGQEAWSEFRRTGYPRIFTAVANNTDCDVNSATGPTRMPYSNDEYTLNLDNIKKAVEMLGGNDNGATRLWWDKKNK